MQVPKRYKDKLIETEERKDKPSAKPGFIDLALGTILGLIVVIMFAQVIFRYILNNSLTWSEEVVRFLFIWLTFLGASILIRERWHIGVDFFMNLPKKYWSLRLQLINTFLVVCFLIFLSISGVLWMYFTRGTVSSALELPLNIIFYGALPVSSFFGVLYGIRIIRKQLKDIKENNNLV